MTAILVQGNSESTRRCDASCHNARKPKCSCVCEGRYHGRREQALALLQDDLGSGRYGEDLAAMAKAAKRTTKSSPQPKELW